VKLHSAEISFLKGEKFHDSFRFPLATTKGSGVHRVEFLQKMVRGKKIIHIGCVDHLPLIDEKRKQGVWLHDILSASADKCIGVDINQEGCDYLKKIGIKDIFCFDIIRDAIPDEIKNQNFDYVILGEIIEHVDNPVEFLSSLRRKFSGLVREMILTTPNAFRFQNLVYSLMKTECINSDHRYWFSPYTLAKVLLQAGYENIEIDTVWFSMNRSKMMTVILKKFIGALFPATKDTLIVKARL
jgi:2-polyprenyl-3-methyl-5-hydroxy-6-metoxy-1,4-benzoquinol methylase